uniref:Phospholipase/carboxylesterase/thioesterase domain-containing protein n=2 Tax=Chaetoceros debilis TaxID=122233 RepID=A0A7S3PYM6_9STRA|mmetsp:Transcript_4567/g.6661  ORF Transcript_4567/g.6661 Transcript_4567/m.6661 type:complete len:338 (+) Transcript_4567:62-1075(+)
MARISTGRLAVIVASLSSTYLTPLSKSTGLKKGFASALSTSSYSRMSPPFSITRDSKSSTVTLTPRDEAAQSGLVVLSHGLGDSSEGLLDLAEHLATQKDLAHLKFILPNAPTRPVTMNMGMPMPSWYDITGLDERSNENCNGIIESRDKIRSILDDEAENTKLPYHRMVLMGFSQGGALSLFTGMQLPKEKKPAGVVLMSGYLPAQSQFTITEGLNDVPILHCHGEADPMVVPAMAQKSQVAVKEMGAESYELKTYKGLPHSINMDEIADVAAFLKKVLPADVDDSCKVELKDPSSMSVKELKAFIRNAGLTGKALGFMEKSEFVRLVQDHRAGKL